MDTMRMGLERDWAKGGVTGDSGQAWAHILNLLTHFPLHPQLTLHNAVVAQPVYSRSHHHIIIFIIVLQ